MHGANADDEQDKRPKHERVERPREQVSRAVAVRTAGPKKIPAIDSDPDRPVDDQRKRNRHGGERKNVPCPPKAAAASEFPERDVQHLSDDEVEREAVEPPGEKSPDGEQCPVDLDVVEQRARDRRGQNRGDSGKPDDRAGCVRARFGGLIRIVT